MARREWVASTPRSLAGVVLLVAATGYTAAIVRWPQLRVTWTSGDARIVVATVGAAVALLAALALQLPHAGDRDPARNALVAALVATAAVHACMLVGFMLVRSGRAADAVAFHGWLGARYVSGLLFIAAALRWPKARVRALVLGVLATLGLILSLSWVFAARLPRMVARMSDGLVVVQPTFAAHVVITGVPLALFALGAVLTWRVALRTGDQIYGWLAAALVLQVLSKVHELVYSLALGPIITTSDVLLLGMLLLLVVVVFAGVRRLSAERAAAVDNQGRDLEALGQAYGSVARLAERERLFRSVVTHELATPIAAVRAYAHVLMAERGTPSQRRAAVDGIAQEAKRLQSLSERMDQLREIEGQRFTPELRVVRTGALLDDAAGFARALAPVRPVAIDRHDHLVHGDPVLLGQALRNLVTNAVRYSPPESRVSLCAARSTPGYVDLEVRDEGPGIPESERERLTGAFVRGADPAEVEGSGLGLFVARRIATAHGGELILRDGPAGGTSAVIRVREAA